MTCDQATFMLERRWDHALCGDEERLLDEHIQACAVCCAEAEAIAMADAAFVHLPEIEPPMNIAAAVAQQIAEEAPAEARRGWVWVSLLALAAAIAGLWTSGFTPSALWNAPVVSAIVEPLAHTVSVWLRPIVLPLEALSPAAGSLSVWLVVILTLELGLIGLWMARRSGGRRAAGHAR